MTNFQIRATDLAGNTDPTPASYTWIIDMTAPIVSITTPTADPTYTTSTSPMTLGGTTADDVGVAQIAWVNDPANLTFVLVITDFLPS